MLNADARNHKKLFKINGKNILLKGWKCVNYLLLSSATVTAINTGEVWVKRSDGNKSKLYIAQLQKGKYTIRHVPY